ncbi:cation-transporting P-type ATPase C [Acetoanaerobium pronyense]|uniref:Cd(2+)-exporting ATPase n=1 Tax=Acetoanaerobium pronyense TaxID=1482736 RepID=A0ABS4KG37_9FIRM|nr:heavy metal translocating P-type ATPase [Acetoanaerobium pronyense]MBP2026226.1 cation-transporting P-type ATPase C [Acetoanaerobium pronyense]
MLKVKTKEMPLMKVQVSHSLPGRLRLRSKALFYLGEFQEALLKSMNKCTSFYSVEYTPITGGILIHYDKDTLNAEDVIDIVESHIGIYSLHAYSAERAKKNSLTVNERRLQDVSVEDMLKRVVISSGALLILGIKTRNIAFQGRKNKTASIISLLLSLDIFKSGVNSLVKTKRPNADTLTATAIITAVLTGRGVSALITILLSDIAELMTAYTISNTRNAIKDMLDTGDNSHFVVGEDGRLLLTPVEHIKPDEVVSIQTGDKLSIDGVVIEGEGYIDQAAITGEFYPSHAIKGQQVYAGTILKSGQIRIKVNRVGDETTVARIVHMVEDAASKKAQIQTYMDKFSARLIPLNFLLAGTMFLFTRDINRALSMMIIDYSCGVRLSTATALSASIYNAARNGVLIKGGNYIEALAQADSLVLDKTGTITEGRPKVTTIICVKDISEQVVIEMASAAEEDSSHPIAYAILEKTKKSGYEIPVHGLIQTDVGQGVNTVVEDKGIVRVGNRRYMKANGIDITELYQDIKVMEQLGEAVVYVSLEDKLLGVIGIHDALKENMKKALNRLRNMGFDDIRLLTGDISFQAEIVASRMHMDDYKGELMPEDKAKTILNMQSSGSKVMMIGDGINDAPALAYADVGIAMGNTRTDVAIESSSVTITNDDPLLIPSTIRLARSTMRTIKENFAMVIGINSIGIGLSAFGIIPVFWSSVLHNSSTIFVVLNSGRLLIKNFERRELN